MKSFQTIAIIIFGLAFFLCGCLEKSVYVEDTPNFLSRVDLTPGEKEKEVSVFLYLYSNKIEYTITTKGDENLYLALNLKNTLKTEEINKLSVSGIDDLIENARVVQIIDEKNLENPLSTRITFKLIDPDTEIKPIIRVEPKQNIESYNNAMNMAKASSAFNESLHKPENSFVAICSVIFWFLLIAVLVVIGIKSKKKKPNHNNHKLIEDQDEKESDEI